MSALTELMKLLGKILTSTEMTNLRLAIATGARMVLRGRYTEDDVRKQANRICSIIRGAHILEVSRLEESISASFIDMCTDLLTAATMEQVFMSIGRVSSQSRESRSEEGSGILG